MRRRSLRGTEAYVLMIGCLGVVFAGCWDIDPGKSAVLSPGDVEEEPPKIVLVSVEDSPDPLNPDVVWVVVLEATFECRPTDAGAGNPNHGKTFAVRVAVLIKDPGGATVCELAQEFPFTYPRKLPASQYHTVPCVLDWDLLDMAGVPVADGVYSYEVQGTLVRYDELGNDKVKEKIVGVSEVLSGTVSVDSTPPVLTPISPAPDSCTNEARPVISASVVDATSGVDPATITLTVDGDVVPVDGDVVPATYDPKTGILSYVPQVDLPEKWIGVALTAADLAGHSASASWQFCEDRTPPTITDVSPPPDSQTNNLTPMIRARTTDSLSGVATETATMTVDGGLVVVSYDAGTESFVYTPPVELPEGYVDVAFEVEDKAGNLVLSTWQFRIATTLPEPAALQEHIWIEPGATTVTIEIESEQRPVVTYVSSPWYLVRMMPPGSPGWQIVFGAVEPPPPDEPQYIYVTTIIDGQSVTIAFEIASIPDNPLTVGAGKTFSTFTNVTDAAGNVRYGAVGKLTRMFELLKQDFSQTEFPDFDRLWRIDVYPSTEPDGAYRESVVIPNSWRPTVAHRLHIYARGGNAALDGDGSLSTGLLLGCDNVRVSSLEVRGYVTGVRIEGAGCLLFLLDIHDNYVGVELGHGIASSCHVWQNDATGVRMSDDATLARSTIEGNKNGVVATGNNMTIRNNKVLYNQTVNLNVHGGQVEVIDNDVFGDGHAPIEFFGWGSGGTLAVRNNIFADSSGLECRWGWSNPCTLVVENNTFCSGGHMDIAFDVDYEERYKATVVFRNNILQHSGMFGTVWFGDEYRPTWDWIEWSNSTWDYNCYYPDINSEVYSSVRQHTLYHLPEDMDGWKANGVDTHSFVADPLFVDVSPGPADTRNYHLKSPAGRYDDYGNLVVIPTEDYSPCIDAGAAWPDPKPVGDEREPNGGRINLGAYGGTDYASKTVLPVVTSASPQGVGVSVLAKIEVGFNRPMDTTTVDETMFEISPVVEGWVEWLGTSMVRFTPLALLEYEQMYTVIVTDSFKDGHGVQLDGDSDDVSGGDYTFTFTTTDILGGAGGSLTVTINTGLADQWTNKPVLDSLTVAVGGGTGSYTVTVNGRAPTSVVVDQFNFDAFSLFNEGPTRLDAFAIDTQGWTGVSTRTVYLDTTPPTVELVVPHRMASGHLRNEQGLPVLVVGNGAGDIELVGESDSPVEHRTKRNVLHKGTSWQVRLAEDLSNITAARFYVFASDHAQTSPPLPPSAWDYVKMPLEAHPHVDLPDIEGKTGMSICATDCATGGVHFFTPLAAFSDNGSDDGEYWVIVEVENEAGGVALTGGLVYLDTRAPSIFDYGPIGSYARDTVELVINERTMWADTERTQSGSGAMRYTTVPPLDLPWEDGYYDEPEPDNILSGWFVDHTATDYAGNVAQGFAADGESGLYALILSDRGVETDHFSGGVAQLESVDDDWETFQEDQFSFEGTYMVKSYITDLTWPSDPDMRYDLAPVKISENPWLKYIVAGAVNAIHVDDVAGRCDGTTGVGPGLVPAPAVYAPQEGYPVQTKTVSIHGDFPAAFAALSARIWGMVMLGNSRGGDDLIRLFYTSSDQEESATVSTSLVQFAGKWGGYDPVVWGDDGEERPPHWWLAGWLPVSVSISVSSEVIGFRKARGLDYYSGYLGGWRPATPGIINMVRAGPSVAIAGERVTVRVVGGGFDAEDVSPANIGDVRVWLIESDDTTGTNKIGPLTDGSGYIVARVVEFDLALVTRYRALEVEFELDDDIELGVYDVAVKVGDIEVAEPAGGHAWKGPENTLRIPRVMNVVKMRLESPAGEDMGVLPVQDARYLNRLAKDEKIRRDAGLAAAASLLPDDAIFYVRVADEQASFPASVTLVGEDEFGNVLDSVAIEIPASNQRSAKPVVAYHGELDSDAKPILEEYYYLIDPRLSRVVVKWHPPAAIAYDTGGMETEHVVEVVFTDETTTFDVEFVSSRYLQDVIITIDDPTRADLSYTPKAGATNTYTVTLTGKEDGLAWLKVNNKWQKPDGTVTEGKEVGKVEVIVTSRVLLYEHSAGSWALGERRAHMVSILGMCNPPGTDPEGFLKPGAKIKSFRYLNERRYYAALYSMAFLPHKLYIHTHGNRDTGRIRWNDGGMRDLLDEPWKLVEPTDPIERGISKYVYGGLDARSEIYYYACNSRQNPAGEGQDGTAVRTKAATGAKCFGYLNGFDHDMNWGFDDPAAFDAWYPGTGWPTKDAAARDVLRGILCSDENWIGLNDANKTTYGWKFAKLTYSTVQGPITEVP